MVKKFTAVLFATSCIAFANTGQPDLAKQIEALKKQVEAQNKRLDELSKKTQASQVSQNSGSCCDSKSSSNSFGDGFLAVPGTNSAVSFIINPVFNTSYDMNAHSGDDMDVSGIPLNGYDGKAAKSGQFNMSARGSEFGINAISHTSKGDVQGVVSFELYNHINSSYAPRLKYAYVDWSDFRIGQDDSTFTDTKAIGQTVDLSSALGANTQPLVRWSPKLTDKWLLQVAAERPYTDYTYSTQVPAGQPAGSSSNLSQETTSAGSTSSTQGTHGTSSIPDIVVGPRYSSDQGHFGVRALVRELGVKKYDTAQTIARKKTAVAYGLSGSVKLVKSTTLFGQFNTGQGLGRYIPDLTGQSALANFNQASSNYGKFDLVRARHYILGLNFVLSEDWQANIIANKTVVTVPSSLPNTSEVAPLNGGAANPNNTPSTFFNKRMTRLYVNGIYSISKNLQMGLEYAYGGRVTSDNRSGKVQRIGFMTAYKF